MKTIFEYHDYRQFLKDYYEEQRSQKPFFTYRYIAQKVGFKSAGHFTQILKGAANISINLIDRFTRFLKLKKKESQYFQCLVLYCQAKTHEDKKHYFDKLIAFQGPSIKLVSADQYEYFSEWYYTAIREILNFFPFKGNYAELSKMVSPSITLQEAKKAVECLLRLGLVVRKASDEYELTDASITSGYKAPSIIVNGHIINYLKLAEKSLDNFDREKRNLSTVSMSISEKGYNTIIEEVRAFRKKIMEIAENDEDVDRAYQFNVQVFPLSNVKKGSRK